MDRQMTLGNVLDFLSQQPADTITPFDRASSYRGFYEQLGLEPGSSTTGEMLTYLETEVQGQVLNGYKGGDFYMTSDTPVWFAYYGDTGPMVMGMSVVDGKIVLALEIYEY